MEFSSCANGSAYIDPEIQKALDDLDRKRAERATEFGDTLMQYTNPVYEPVDTAPVASNTNKSYGAPSGPVSDKLRV